MGLQPSPPGPDGLMLHDVTMRYQALACRGGERPALGVPAVEAIGSWGQPGRVDEATQSRNYPSRRSFWHARTVEEAEFERAELRARVIGAWLEGETPTQVSTRLGISANRVHIILASTPGLVEERSRREALAESALKATALEWSRSHYGTPLSEGAEALGIPLARLRHLIGEHESFHKRRPAPRGESEFARAELRAWVITAWLAGQNYSQIGAALGGISANGASNIIKSTPGLLEERQRRETRAEEDLKATAVAWSQAHLTVPLSDGAEKLGMPIARLRHLLGDRASFHPRRYVPRRQFTDKSRCSSTNRHCCPC